MQIPEMHEVIPTQRLPHMPQLVGSFVRLTQLPPASSGQRSGYPIDGHAHPPSAQKPLNGHRAPQDPQFAASDDRSAHSWPHRAIPSAHASAPSTQLGAPAPNTSGHPASTPPAWSAEASTPAPPPALLLLHAASRSGTARIPSQR